MSYITYILHILIKYGFVGFPKLQIPNVDPDY